MASHSLIAVNCSSYEGSKVRNDLYITILVTSLSDFFSFLFNFLRHIDILSFFFLSILILCHAFNIFSYFSQDINFRKYFVFCIVSSSFQLLWCVVALLF